MKAIELKSKTNGKIAASIYTVIVILFLFLKMCSPNPKDKFDNEGVIMVNLGITETGKTDNTPTAESQEIEEVSQPEEIVEETPPEEVIEESVTQDVEEVEVTAQEETASNESTQTTTTETESTESTENVETTNTEATETAEPEKEKPVSDPNALFSGNNNSNQGDGNENGDKGSEEGSTESNIYGNISGSGLGNSGKGWGLNGRSLGHKPTPVSTKQEYGKVTVKIYVSKNGKVFKAQFSSIGSTTTDKYLIDLSVKEAYKVTFNADPKAPDTQIGFVTFHYKAS